MIRIVSGWSILFCAVTLFFSLIAPVLVAVRFVKKTAVSYTVVAAGALTFIVFQLLLRLPLLQLLVARFPGLLPAAGDLPALFVYTLFLSLTAALFEEGGRWLVFKFFVKKQASWQNGVAFGIGHGGGEAVLLVGLNYMLKLLFLVLIKLDLNPFGGTMFYLLENSKAQLLQTPPYMFLLAGLERVFVIPVHVAFSVLVVLAVAKGDARYFLCAFAGHVFLNLPTMLTVFPAGPVVFYAYLALACVLALIWLKKAKKYFPENPVP